LAKSKVEKAHATFGQKSDYMKKNSLISEDNSSF